MAVRYLQTADRLVVSKPTFNAGSPSLADSDKIFDSNWDFSGVLIASGVVTDPAPIASGDPFGTTSTAPIRIDFPPPGYIPCAYVFCEHPYGNQGFDNVGFNGMMHTFPAGRSFQDLPGEFSTVNADHILIIRSRAANANFRRRYPGVLRYMVFGISQ